MSTLTLSIGRPTLADRIFARGLVVDLVLIVAGAALTAVAAQIVVPMFPVPITGQTLAVLLVGVSLGALRGGLSMGLYALLGIVGVPVFSESTAGWEVIAGPTGGYIIGFVLSAVFVGWLAQRRWDRKILQSFLAFLAGTVVTFVPGLIWLSAWYGANGFATDLQSVLMGGFYPFIIGGLIKAALGAAIIWAAWYAIGRNEKRNSADA